MQGLCLLDFQNIEDLLKHLPVLQVDVYVHLSEDLKELILIKDLAGFRDLVNPVSEVAKFHLDVIFQLRSHASDHTLRLIPRVQHAALRSLGKFVVGIYSSLLAESELNQN